MIIQVSFVFFVIKSPSPRFEQSTSRTRSAAAGGLFKCTSDARACLMSLSSSAASRSLECRFPVEHSLIFLARGEVRNVASKVAKKRIVGSPCFSCSGRLKYLNHVEMSTFNSCSLTGYDLAEGFYGGSELDELGTTEQFSSISLINTSETIFSKSSSVIKVDVVHETSTEPQWILPADLKRSVDIGCHKKLLIRWTVEEPEEGSFESESPQRFSKPKIFPLFFSQGHMRECHFTSITHLNGNAVSSRDMSDINGKFGETFVDSGCINADSIFSNDGFLLFIEVLDQD